MSDLLDIFAVPGYTYSATFHDVTVEIQSVGRHAFYTVHDWSTGQFTYLATGFAPSLADALRITWHAAGWDAYLDHVFPDIVIERDS